MPIDLRDILRRYSFGFATMVLATIFLPGFAIAHDSKHANRWDRFHGPDGSGVLKSSRVQLPWHESQIVRLDLPGAGNGSPIIVGDQAFLLAADPADATRHMVCINLEEPSIAWRRSYNSKPHGLHKFSSYASTTPCADSDRVYVAWGEPEHVFVKAFSFDGQEQWTRDLGRYVSQHGFGTSPIVEDGKLILLNSQDAQELPPGVEPGGDTMVALDCNSGTTLWESHLPPTRVCYGVPRVRKIDGISELLCCTTGQGIFGLDMGTGTLRWSHDCFTQRVCASVLLIGNKTLIGSHGSGGGKDNRVVAFDLESKRELFHIDRAAPYVPTPVSDGENLYLWSDNGIVTCVDLQRGTTRWSERIGGNFSASPVIVGNVLVNASHDGVVTFLAPSSTFAKLGSFDTQQTIRSSIAATDDYVLLRTDNQLWIVK